MCKLLVPYVGKPECLLTQEWPKKSALWHEGTYRNVRGKLGLVFGRDVNRCSFDGVYKRWYFAANQESWCKQFSPSIAHFVRTSRTGKKVRAGPCGHWHCMEQPATDFGMAVWPEATRQFNG